MSTPYEFREQANARPEPFEFYTARDLWTDEYTSKQMLACHLNPDIDVSSRKAAFIDRSVDWIASHFNVDRGFKIVDFGCGPGLYTSRLARLGAEVTGIDFSRRSIEYARETASREGLSIQYANENYLEFKTDTRFDLAMMIMCDFCALGPAQRQKILSTFSAILTPGGAVLLDVYSLAAFNKREEASKCEENLLNGFWSAEKYYGFLNTFKYEKKKVVLDKYTIVEADRVRTVYNWLQYFDPEDLKREFTAAGFTVENLYADVAGAPFDPEASEYAVVARKA